MSVYNESLRCQIRRAKRWGRCIAGHLTHYGQCLTTPFPEHRTAREGLACDVGPVRSRRGQEVNVISNVRAAIELVMEVPATIGIGNDVPSRYLLPSFSSLESRNRHITIE